MGDYIYERFTPDRFQAFCSALLVKEYPHLQVFPVGQADGGRDAVVPQSRINPELLVIQVKFKRQLRVNEDYATWLKKAVMKEEKSILRLIDRGAKQYTLVTNVPGTGGPDNGSIDKLDSYLRKTFSIPVQVLWRDDLDARISGQYDLKWVFSEILATPDVVRALLEEGLGSDKKRRYRALDGYLRSQYETDAFVKFKQADLQASDILDLFIDVPGDLPPQMKLSQIARQEIADMVFEIHEHASQHQKMDDSQALWTVRAWATDAGAERFFAPTAPTGSLLLHPTAAKRLPRVLVEGAPGQGKSTLAQYICQVHRMHFLGKEEDLKRLPVEHRLAPTRIPFKIDLRDLATWIEGYDPRKPKIPVEHGMNTSLETFIAAEVHYLSGGQEFSASDLHEMASTAPIVVVLDGFDEIATSDQRAKVVREIDRGLGRLSDGAFSVQAIVTSRPSAMPDAPTFNRLNWTTVALSSITNDLALEYAKRWSRARNLNSHESDEILSILSDKIQSPHLRDLARNPMQLTILLNLIHARGQSLPDQRTALYTSYIEVFFNREAEKTRVVKQNRQILIDLHGYLAWKMHADAEQSRGDGRLTAEELEELIRGWLRGRDYPITTVDDLFQGIVQRIVAIVSRVEGTFEFEVQPLREYFAAHHLYHTAPYSPPGQAQTGTKPHILDALLKNPYWQNVLRFFAGFYSVGEIPGLATELIDRLSDASTTAPLYYRVLSINLLGDWVFHQTPTWTRKVTEAAADDLTLRLAAPRIYARWADLHLALPPGCGGEHVGRIAYQKLSDCPSRALGEIVLKNMPDHEATERWLNDARDVDPDGIRKHILKGRYLNILSSLSEDEYSALRASWSDVADAGHRLLAAGCGAAMSDPRVRNQVLPSALTGNVLFRHLPGSWGRLAAALDPIFLSAAVLQGRGVTFADASERRAHRLEGELGTVLAAFDEAFSDRATAAGSLLPWQKVIDSLEGLQTGSFLSHLVANVSAGVKAPNERGAGAGSLFQASVPLSQRARAARLRMSKSDWWGTQLKSADSADDRAAWAMYLTSWGDDSTIVAHAGDLQSILEELPAYQLEMLIRSSRAVAEVKPKRPTSISWTKNFLSERFLVLFMCAVRGNRLARERVIEHFRSPSVETPRWAGYWVQAWLLQGLDHSLSRSDWQTIVKDFERLQASEEYESAHDAYRSRLSWHTMPINTAKKILNEPLRMPAAFVYAAVSRLSKDVPPARALGEVAAEADWAVN